MQKRKQNNFTSGKYAHKLGTTPVRISYSPHVYLFSNRKNNIRYIGCENLSEKSLDCNCILNKVAGIQYHSILNSKDFNRQYEFDLDINSKTYLHLRLFIKDKNLFFKEGNTESFRDGLWQMFIFTHENLMSLSDENLDVILRDFD